MPAGAAVDTTAAVTPSCIDHGEVPCVTPIAAAETTHGDVPCVEEIAQLPDWVAPTAAAETTHGEVPWVAETVPDTTAVPETVAVVTHGEVPCVEPNTPESAKLPAVAVTGSGFGIGKYVIFPLVLVYPPVCRVEYYVNTA